MSDRCTSSCPDGIDDPARPSGGNVYDRRVCDGLAARAGRCASTPCRAPGRARRRGADALAVCWRGARRRRRAGRRAGRLGGPRRAACPQSRRLRLVVLVHMPLGQRGDRRRRRTDAECACCRPPPRWSPRASGPGRGCCDRYAAGPRPGARRRARRRLGRAARRHATRRRAALRRRGDAGQGPRRAGRGAGDPVADLPWRCVCVGEPDPRPRVRAELREPPRPRRARRAGAVRRAAARRRARRVVRRGGPAGARHPGRDLRDGRHRGARARAAGGRDRRRRAARGARRAARRPHAGAAGAARRPGRPRRALRRWLTDDRPATRLRATPRRCAAALSADRIGAATARRQVAASCCAEVAAS